MDVTVVGVTSCGAADGADPSRARATAETINRTSKWRMRDCDAAYDGNLPPHNDRLD